MRGNIFFHSEWNFVGRGQEKGPTYAPKLFFKLKWILTDFFGYFWGGPFCSLVLFLPNTSASVYEVLLLNEVHAMPGREEALLVSAIHAYGLREGTERGSQIH